MSRSHCGGEPAEAGGFPLGRWSCEAGGHEARFQEHKH